MEGSYVEAIWDDQYWGDIETNLYNLFHTHIVAQSVE
jgi:hypothetical protein